MLFHCHLGKLRLVFRWFYFLGHTYFLVIITINHYISFFCSHLWWEMVAIPLWQYCLITVPPGLSHWSKYVHLVCGSLHFLLYLLIGLFARTTFLIFVCVIVALASVYVCSPLHYMFACDGFMHSTRKALCFINSL